MTAGQKARGRSVVFSEFINMARVQLQFRRVTALICSIGRLNNRATSIGNQAEGLSTTLEPGSLGKHCPRFSLLWQPQNASCFEKPSYSFPKPFPWSTLTWHRDSKALQRSPLYDPCVSNTSIIRDMIEMEHIGDSFDNKSDKMHVSSVLKKRKKKMNKHKYKKRRKLDKYKRRTLENVKERKRRVKERAAARE